MVVTRPANRARAIGIVVDAEVLKVGGLNITVDEGRDHNNRAGSHVGAIDGADRAHHRDHHRRKRGAAAGGQRGDGANREVITQVIRRRVVVGHDHVCDAVAATVTDRITVGHRLVGSDYGLVRRLDQREARRLGD